MMEFKPGDLINRKWRLEKLIGEGTSGIVFSSWDELQERKGAIKLYKARKETFDRERILQTRLRVPHVVEIYEVNFTDDSREFPYKAEQFIDGLNLDRWAEEKNLEERLDILVQIAEGLKGIHEKKVTHNDVKPANIVIDKNDYAWLVDFGISRSDSLVWDRMRGAKSYAPPEKFDNPEHIDEKVDVYAFGATAYELLTGQMPFAAGSIEGLIKKIKQDVPKNTKELNPEISEDINEIIMKCLEKKPEDRFRDGEELFWHLDGAVNKRVAYVVGKYEDVGVEDEEGMRKMAGELLKSIFRNKIAPLIEEKKIPAGQFPYGIQKGRKEWFLTDARYWTAGFWPGILWMGYEVTGEERFKKWAEEWTKALDIKFEDRFRLNVLGANAYYGYVPAFEITGNDFYRKKILESTEEIKKGFNDKLGFIQVDDENSFWIYSSLMESCLPLLVWAYNKTKDEQLKKIIHKQARNSIKYLLREDGSVRYIAEIDLKTGEILKDINSVSRNPISRRAREQARMMFGLSLIDGFDDEKEKLRDYFLAHVPKDGVACYDLNNFSVSNTTKDASSMALFSLALDDPYKEIKIFQSLISDCLSKDENYPGNLLHSCENRIRPVYSDSPLIYGEYYLFKEIKEIKNY